MSIPESQLETWSHQGAIAGSSAAYASIQAALDACRWRDGVVRDVYLQGSYRNDTNIRGDSDVDVVVQLSSTFRSDIKLLSPGQVARYAQAVSDANYTFSAFRDDVVSALRAYYGYFHVTPGTKSIKVKSAPKSGGIAVDVVPCIQFRSYFQFYGGDDDYLEGMTFETDELLLSHWIVNYPKLHWALGVEKHSPGCTDGWFKPLVRVFKNARSAFNDGRWEKVNAPSYFIEGLLSQVPDALYGGTYQKSFVNIVDWCYAALRSPMATALLCQNRQLPLFGDRPEQWRLDDGRAFIEAMVSLWKEWS